MKKTILLFALLLAGCAEPTPKAIATKPAEQTGRFEITDFAQWRDEDRAQWIMAVKDKQTGDEYIAISGAGIHKITKQAGKTTKTVQE